MEKCVVKQFKSSDTNVSKFVFEFETACVEAVLYRYEEYRKRTVICCSTQCGCRCGCKFCGTGKQFIRNMNADEIIYQVDQVLSTIDCDTHDIQKFQIMFMSMGEPFMNYDALKSAIKQLALKYENAQLLVSTSAPIEIKQHIDDFCELSKQIPRIGLQFSVHASTDEARKQLIPISTCTLADIASIGEKWAATTGRKPFYNYCAHNGNSSEADAIRLTAILKPEIWETTLSVICSKFESIKFAINRQLDIINGFSQKLLSRGASVKVFNPAGQDDIGGGCGQLWYFQKWFSEHKTI